MCRALRTASFLLEALTIGVTGLFLSLRNCAERLYRAECLSHMRAPLKKSATCCAWRPKLHVRRRIARRCTPPRLGATRRPGTRDPVGEPNRKQQGVLHRSLPASQSKLEEDPTPKRAVVCMTRLDRSRPEADHTFKIGIHRRCACSSGRSSGRDMAHVFAAVCSRSDALEGTPGRFYATGFSCTEPAVAEPHTVQAQRLLRPDRQRDLRMALE